MPALCVLCLCLLLFFASERCDRTLWCRLTATGTGAGLAIALAIAIAIATAIALATATATATVNAVPVGLPLPQCGCHWLLSSRPKISCWRPKSIVVLFRLASGRLSNKTQLHQSNLAYKRAPN